MGCLACGSRLGIQQPHAVLLCCISTLEPLSFGCARMLALQACLHACMVVVSSCLSNACPQATIPNPGYVRLNVVSREQCAVIAVYARLLTWTYPFARALEQEKRILTAAASSLLLQQPSHQERIHADSHVTAPNSLL